MRTVTTSRGLSGEASGADGLHDPSATRAGHEMLRLWGLFLVVGLLATVPCSDAHRHPEGNRTIRDFSRILRSECSFGTRHRRLLVGCLSDEQLCELLSCRES
jgi:hypothetical protein